MQVHCRKSASTLKNRPRDSKVDGIGSSNTVALKWIDFIKNVDFHFKKVKYLSKSVKLRDFFNQKRCCFYLILLK